MNIGNFIIKLLGIGTETLRLYCKDFESSWNQNWNLNSGIPRLRIGIGAEDWAEVVPESEPKKMELGTSDT